MFEVVTPLKPFAFSKRGIRRAARLGDDLILEVDSEYDGLSTSSLTIYEAFSPSDLGESIVIRPLPASEFLFQRNSVPVKVKKIIFEVEE